MGDGVLRCEFANLLKGSDHSRIMVIPHTVCGMGSPGLHRPRVDPIK